MPVYLPEGTAGLALLGQLLCHGLDLVIPLFFLLSEHPGRTEVVHGVASRGILGVVAGEIATKPSLEQGERAPAVENCRRDVVRQGIVVPQVVASVLLRFLGEKDEAAVVGTRQTQVADHKASGLDEEAHEVLNGLWWFRNPGDSESDVSKIGRQRGSEIGGGEVEGERERRHTSELAAFAGPEDKTQLALQRVSEDSAISTSQCPTRPW